MMLTNTSYPFLPQCCLPPRLPEPEIDVWVGFSFLFRAVTLSRDNPMSDIYGANLYNNYLKSAQRNQAQAGVKRSPQAAGPQNEDHLAVESCKSILVCTGVYRHSAEAPSKPEKHNTETVFHGHRDFSFDPSLVEASYVVQDVNEAVQLAFQKENWS